MNKSAWRSRYQWVQQINPIYGAILWHFVLRQLITKSNRQVKMAHNWAPVLHQTLWLVPQIIQREIKYLCCPQEGQVDRLVGHGSENWLAGVPLAFKYSLISWMRKQSIKNYVTSRDLIVSDVLKIYNEGLYFPAFSCASSYLIFFNYRIWSSTSGIWPSNLNSERVVNSKHEY